MDWHKSFIHLSSSRNPQVICGLAFMQGSGCTWQCEHRGCCGLWFVKHLLHSVKFACLLFHRITLHTYMEYIMQAFIINVTLTRRSDGEETVIGGLVSLVCNVSQIVLENKPRTQLRYYIIINFNLNQLSVHHFSNSQFLTKEHPLQPRHNQSNLVSTNAITRCTKVGKFFKSKSLEKSVRR